jgi:hypothetical protein
VWFDVWQGAQEKSYTLYDCVLRSRGRSNIKVFTADFGFMGLETMGRCGGRKADSGFAWGFYTTPLYERETSSFRAILLGRCKREMARAEMKQSSKARDKTCYFGCANC